jgi:hypothetical protein
MTERASRRHKSAPILTAELGRSSEERLAALLSARHATLPSASVRRRA